jgi:hypothetical protein
MKYSIFSLLFLSILLSMPLLVYGQLDTSFQTEIDVDMVPSNPKPSEIVQVTLNTFATDINSAKITWKIDGKVVKSGIGEKVFTFTTGESGTRTTLGITVETKEGEVINRSITIKPITVDLIWQSYGFVPPFYKGKSLFSHQNELTVIAVPHLPSSSGAEISPSNLLYTWKKDGSVVSSESGYGKNTFSFEGSLISRPVLVEVSVSSLNSSDTGYANTNIDPIEPSVVLYKKDPLYGIEFQKALSGTRIIENTNEISIIGMPFFFGTLVPNPRELIYKWSVNGSPIGNEPDQMIQVFRQKAGTSGSSNISLNIENENKILQSAYKDFDLLFKAVSQ